LDLNHNIRTIKKPMSRKRVRSDDVPATAASSSSSSSSIAWRDEFEKLTELPKPDDPRDTQVSIPAGARCDFSKVSVGSLLYRPAKIVVLTVGGNCNVRNQELHAAGASGADWQLGSSLISSQCWSPDQYTETKKITQTEMALKIKEEVGDCICKVEFTKIPDVAEMAALIAKGSQLIESSGSSDTEKKKLYKKLYERSQEGEYRIMRGYILRGEDQQTQETETGMIRFIDADLMAEGKHSMRVINLRAVKALTFKLIKYVLK
jgi:hypothetical protein